MRPLSHVRGSVTIEMLLSLKSSTAIGTDERPLRPVNGKVRVDGVAIVEHDMALWTAVGYAPI